MKQDSFVLFLNLFQSITPVPRRYTQRNVVEQTFYNTSTLQASGFSASNAFVCGQIPPNNSDLR